MLFRSVVSAVFSCDQTGLLPMARKEIVRIRIDRLAFCIVFSTYSQTRGPEQTVTSGFQEQSQSLQSLNPSLSLSLLSEHRLLASSGVRLKLSWQTLATSNCVEFLQL